MNEFFVKHYDHISGSSFSTGTVTPIFFGSGVPLPIIMKGQCDLIKEITIFLIDYEFDFEIHNWTIKIIIPSDTAATYFKLSFSDRIVSKDDYF